MNLSEGQKMLLAEVQVANKELRDMKLIVDVQARALTTEFLKEARGNRDLAIGAAFVSGIPKMRIGREGLGTKDSTTVMATLKKMGMVATV